MCSSDLQMGRLIDDLLGGAGDRRDVAPALVVEFFRGVLAEEAGEAVDVAQRRAQIMGDGVGEGPELLVGGLELRVLPRDFFLGGGARADLTARNGARRDDDDNRRETAAEQKSDDRPSRRLGLGGALLQ